MYVGIEIGGTKLQLGVGPGDGTIIALERAKVDAAAGAERIRQQIIELVPALLAKAGLTPSDIRAVGIGFGGPVDAEKGIVTKSHQIEGWAGFPLAAWSRRELGWPTVVHNDADTAGLAEACFGAGRGLSPIFYITIGSGIGGGLIIDQKIYRGAGDGAGEFGHLVVGNPVHMWRTAQNSDSELLPTGTVEATCSGWGMARRLKETIEQFSLVRDADAKQVLELTNGNLENLTAEDVARVARLGNCHAQQVLLIACRVLGWAVAQVVTLLCPKRIVIGGGVSQMGEELLFGPLRKEVARFVFPAFAASFDIVPASLGEAVVVHGSLRIARDFIGDNR
jgi:glucokinase